jgi:hypothetical protein
MFLREEDGRTRTATCLSANLFTIYPIWNGLGLYPVLYGEWTATNRLSMAFWIVQIKRVFVIFVLNLNDLNTNS